MSRATSAGAFFLVLALAMGAAAGAAAPGPAASEEGEPGGELIAQAIYDRMILALRELGVR